MLCVSVSERKVKECLDILDGLREDEMAEIRVDLVSALAKGTSEADPGLSSEEMEMVWKHPCRKIATCRDLQGLQGPGFTEERRKVLERAMALPSVQLVDIEYEAPKEYREALVNCARTNDVQVIISYHNYDDTPTDQELVDIVKNCFDFGADIAKIAVQSNSKQDSARVLSLYNDDRKIVALAMGQHGMITRIAAIPLGSPFTFVANSAEKATAPGQLTLDQMRSIASTVQGQPNLKKQKQR